MDERWHAGPAPRRHPPSPPASTHPCQPPPAGPPPPRPPPSHPLPAQHVGGRAGGATGAGRCRYCREGPPRGSRAWSCLASCVARGDEGEACRAGRPPEGGRQSQRERVPARTHAGPAPAQDPARPCTRGGPRASPPAPPPPLLPPAARPPKAWAGPRGCGAQNGGIGRWVLGRFRGVCFGWLGS